MAREQDQGAVVAWCSHGDSQMGVPEVAVWPPTTPAATSRDVAATSVTGTNHCSTSSNTVSRGRLKRKARNQQSPSDQSPPETSRQTRREDTEW